MLISIRLLLSETVRTTDVSPSEQMPAPPIQAPVRHTSGQTNRVGALHDLETAFTLRARQESSQRSVRILAR